MIHSLSERDTGRRTATCSVCGPVKIRRSGTGFVCAEKAKQHVRAYKRRHPQRSRESRTEHVLDWQDAELGTGLCRKCGPVDIVPWGRGYACGARAKELGRVNPQDAPQTWCRDCQAADGVLVWLSADGCSRCKETDLSAGLRAAEDLHGQMDDLEPGFHLVGGDPYSMPEYESAVPGWKTLG